MRYLVLLLLFLSFPALAEQEGFTMDMDSLQADSFDFGSETSPEQGSGFPLQGKLSFDLGYQIGKPQRWVTFGPYGQFIYDQQSEAGQFYAQLTLRNNYAFDIEKDPQSVIDRYQIDPIWRDAYWKKAFGDFSLTLGKNIVTWGKADLFTVIDVISPIDNRGTLFAKPEEIKLGQNLVKLDWYHGSHQISLIYIPSAVNNLQIEAGHPYAPALPFKAVNQQSDDHPEWAIRWNQTWDKWELSVISAEVHQRDPIYYATATPGIYEQSWEKNQVVGIGVNAAADPFLWKAEILYSKNRPVQLLSFNGSKQVEYIKGVWGFDYASSRFGTWLLENFWEQPVKDDPSLVNSSGNKITAIGWFDTFLQDDLTINIVFMSMENIANNLFRGIVRYQLDDSWSISSQLSLLDSNGNNAYLNAISNFDRFDISLEYNFDLANGV